MNFVSDIEFERKESMLNDFEDGGKQMKNEHQLRAQQLAQEKGKYHFCIIWNLRYLTGSTILIYKVEMIFI